MRAHTKKQFHALLLELQSKVEAIASRVVACGRYCPSIPSDACVSHLANHDCVAMVEQQQLASALVQ